MMTHESEDTLLELALGLMNAASENRVRTHLQECPACRVLFNDVERTLSHIKNVTPDVSAGIPPLPSLMHNRYSWLRVAAMLAVGFGLGFVTSESLRSPPITIVRQQIVPKPPELPEVGFVACDEVDLTVLFR
jgi:predicted anti-sigma-YlaC factor YlaD